MRKNRIFVSFAMEDERARDFLVGQAKNERSPFEFIDMSVKQPWDNAWKTQCRTKLKGCDGVIALISRNTRNADGAKWEINCANEERIPLIGVYAYSDDRSAAPSEMNGKRIIDWSWAGIASFINNLPN